VSRIRTIKPEAFESLTLARVPIEARWLFAGIWTACDDEGRLPCSVALIRAKVFPVEDVTLAQVQDWVDDLLAHDHLCRYKVDGDEFLHVPRWHDHQVINRPSPSRIPPCPNHPGGKQGPPPSPGRIPPMSGPSPSGPEPPRRCPKHANDPTAPSCGACKEARLYHEAWEKSNRERTSREKDMAANTLCGSAACTCDHITCDVGWVTVPKTLRPSGRVVDVQAKCPSCFPNAPKPKHAPVTFLDAREFGAEYSDAGKAAAGDK
jgi:hypothetical protein